MSFSILSRIEDYIGTRKYIILLFLILFISSILDYIITLLFPSIHCSIGFSGILFGLLSWETIVLNDFNFFVLIILLINVVSPSLQNSKASLIGH